MRILLYTGKGGVGKTSVAAATAIRCADLGYRTAVISTDAAHSLADSFDVDIGPEPTELAPNLWAQEVDVLYQMDRYWGTVQRWLSSVLAWRGVSDIIAEEVSVFPGMEEVASLLQIVHLNDSGEFDVIVVDCAPTGETLRFLSMPEVARWYLTRIFPLERQAARIAGPILRSMADLPIPEDEVFEAIKNLLLQLNEMQVLLTNPDLTSIRLVLNPEKMVIKEAQRTFTFLNLYDFHCDLVVSNRIIPERVEDAYFDAWKTSQDKWGRLAEEGFAPLPILEVPLFDQEVVGFDMLRRMAEATYSDRDPTELFYKGRIQTIEKLDGEYQMELALPFIQKEAVNLTRSGGELVISIGNFRRNLLLPRALADLEVKRAKMENQRLVITFGNSKRGT
ncbi:MAG: ArsA family ATPase [Anaerolineae bacterium]